MTAHRHLAALCLAGCLLPGAGCKTPAPPPAPVSLAFDNAALGLQWSAPPAGFAVTRNEGGTLELAPTDGARGGRMWVTVGERSDFGLEIVKLVNEQKGVFEGLPNGRFSGSRKLVAPTGEAFYSRGQFDDETATAVEEVRVFTTHPVENRLVTLHYRYPLGNDSAARLPEILELLGSMGALAALQAGPAPAGD